MSINLPATNNCIFKIDLSYIPGPAGGTYSIALSDTIDLVGKRTIFNLKALALTAFEQMQTTLHNSEYWTLVSSSTYPNGGYILWKFNSNKESFIRKEN